MVLTDPLLEEMTKSCRKHRDDIKAISKKYTFDNTNPKPKTFTEGRFAFLQEVASLAQNKDLSEDAVSDIYDVLNQYTITRKKKTGGAVDIINPYRKVRKRDQIDAATEEIASDQKGTGVSLDQAGKGDADTADANATNADTADADATNADAANADTTNADAADAAGKDDAADADAANADAAGKDDAANDADKKKEEPDPSVPSVPAGGIMPAFKGVTENDVHKMFEGWKVSQIDSRARPVLANYTFRPLAEGEPIPASPDRKELIKELLLINSEVPDVRDNIQGVLNKYDISRVGDATAGLESDKAPAAPTKSLEDRLKNLEDLEGHGEIVKLLVEMLESQRKAAPVVISTAPAAAPAPPAPEPPPPLPPETKKKTADTVLDADDSPDKAKRDYELKKKKMEEATKKFKIIQPWPDPHFTRETVVRDEFMDALWKAMGKAEAPPPFVTAYTGPLDLLSDVVQFASAVAQNTIGNDEVRKMVATGAKSYLTAIISKFLLQKEGEVMEKVAEDKTPGAAVQLLQKILTSIAMPVAPPVKAQPKSDKPPVKTQASESVDKLKAKFQGAVTQVKTAATEAKGTLGKAATKVTDNASVRKAAEELSKKTGVKINLPQISTDKAHADATGKPHADATGKPHADTTGKPHADDAAKKADAAAKKAADAKLLADHKADEAKRKADAAAEGKVKAVDKAKENIEAKKQTALELKTAKATAAAELKKAEAEEKALAKKAASDEAAAKKAASNPKIDGAERIRLQNVAKASAAAHGEAGLNTMALKNKATSAAEAKAEFKKTAAADLKEAQKNLAEQSKKASVTDYETKAANVKAMADKKAADADAAKLAVLNLKADATPKEKAAANKKALDAANAAEKAQAEAGKAEKAHADAVAAKAAADSTVSARLGAVHTKVAETTKEGVKKIADTTKEGAKNIATGAYGTVANATALGVGITGQAVSGATNVVGKTLTGTKNVLATATQAVYDPRGAATKVAEGARKLEENTREARAKIAAKVSADFSKAKDSAGNLLHLSGRKIDAMSMGKQESKAQAMLTDLIADVRTAREIVKELELQHQKDLEEGKYPQVGPDNRLALKNIDEAKVRLSTAKFKLQEAQHKSNNNDSSAALNEPDEPSAAAPAYTPIAATSANKFMGKVLGVDLQDKAGTPKAPKAATPKARTQPALKAVDVGTTPGEDTLGSDMQDRGRSRGGKRRKKHPTLRARRTPTRRSKRSRSKSRTKTRRGRRRFSVGD